jgi:YD repeat-containing protein
MSQSLIRHLSVPFLILSCAALSGCGGEKDSNTDTAEADPGSGPTATDGDSDGVSVEDGDCDDANEAVYPGAEEVCDGVDNNCDGRTDEDMLKVKNTPAGLSLATIRAVDRSMGLYDYFIVQPHPMGDCTGGPTSCGHIPDDDEFGLFPAPGVTQIRVQRPSGGGLGWFLNAEGYVTRLEALDDDEPAVDLNIDASTGRVTSSTWNKWGSSWYHTYEYNELGQLTSAKNFLGDTDYTYSYDSEGRMVEFDGTDSDNNRPYFYLYGEWDGEQTITYHHSGHTNSIKDHYVYDSSGNRVRYYSTSRAGSGVDRSPDYIYDYDAEGNLTSMGWSDGSQTRVLLYDNNNIIGVQRSGEEDWEVQVEFACLGMPSILDVATEQNPLP